MREYTRRELALIRIKCDKDLLFFTRFFYKVLRGTKFIVNHHHETICNELHRVENYELELLNINIPPRFSKTELAAVNFIARGVGMNPTSNWLYITASDELRAQTSVSIRDIVTHPYFKIMYGVELKKDQNGKNLWRTSQGGGLKTATIFGQVTGFGAGQMIEHDTELNDYIRTFEGCIVLDDINKIDDSGQENANNEKVSRVLFNTILSRKNSKDTPLINIQQRAGVSDATAQLEEHYKDNPKAEFLVMPIVSPDGVPLWEWKHDLEDIERLRNGEHTGNVFATQYMQEPVDLKGILVPFSSLQFTSRPKEESTIIARLAFCDPAEGGGDSLSTIFVDLTYIEDVFRCHILDVVHSKLGSDSQSVRIVDKIKRNNIERIFVEGNGVGMAMLSELRHIGTGSCVIQGYKERMNKDGKINAYYEFVRDFFTFNIEQYANNKEYQEFVKHLTSYGVDSTNKGKKDALDVCCSAARRLKTNYNKLIYK